MKKNRQHGGQHREKLQLDRSLPVRSSARDARHYSRMAERVWQLLIVSLLIDPFLVKLMPLLPAVVDGRNHWQAALWLLLALALGAIVLRERVLDLSINGREIRDHVMAHGGKLTTFIILGLLAIAGLAEFVMHVGLNQLAPLLVGCLIFAVWMVTNYRELRKQLNERRDRERDRLVWLEHADSQLFVLVVLSFVPARLAALAALLAYSPADAALPFWLSWCGAGLLLAAAKPSKADFVVICRTCSQETSRALKSAGHCPACARREFTQPVKAEAAGAGRIGSPPMRPGSAARKKAPAQPVKAPPAEQPR